MQTSFSELPIVSTCRLTMQVEAVTHVLHWIASRSDSQTTYAIRADSISMLQKLKSGMRSPDWHVSMDHTHCQKFLWMYCPGHARMKGTDWADSLVGKTTITSGFCLEIYEVLRSLRHYLWAQSQRHSIVIYSCFQGLLIGLIVPSVKN